MNTEKIISEVKDAILRHAKPERIWLYGSRANGLATQTSDIDMAFEDKDFKEIWLIDEDLGKLPTLLKMDAKNIAHAEERFRQRVLSTGRTSIARAKSGAVRTGSIIFVVPFSGSGRHWSAKKLWNRKAPGIISWISPSSASNSRLICPERLSGAALVTSGWRHSIPVPVSRKPTLWAC